MVFVSFTGLDGSTILVNVADNDLAELTAIPSGSLPAGVTDGTNIDYDDGRRIQVQGTPAATATVLAGGGIAPSNAIYVDTAGNDSTGQRGSAAFPFLTMAAALAVAHSGDEILVSGGTYTGAFTLPAIANLIIRGEGSFPGETILATANNADICTLNAANRSILFNNISLVGAGTGRPIVGTGATAAGAWLSTGGLVLDQVILTSSGAGVNAIALTDAGQVVLRNTNITVGAAAYTTCSSVFYETTIHSGAVTWNWDDTDANKPSAGQSSGFQLLMGSIITGTTTLTGQAKIATSSGSTLAALTGNNLSVAAGPVSPSITVAGTVGAVDFQSTAAKRLPASTLGSFTVNFNGATLNGNFSVCVASGAARQIVSMIGATASGITITADALCDINARGAAFSTPTYASANTGALGIGTLVPPYLAMSGLDIHAGGALAFTFTGGFTAPAGGIAMVSQSNTGGAALAASVSQTQVTITSTAQAGNTAAAYIVWP